MGKPETKPITEAEKRRRVVQGALKLSKKATVTRPEIEAYVDSRIQSLWELAPGMGVWSTFFVALSGWCKANHGYPQMVVVPEKLYEAMEEAARGESGWMGTVPKVVAGIRVIAGRTESVRFGG